MWFCILDGGEVGLFYLYFGFSYCCFVSFFIVVVFIRRCYRLLLWFFWCVGIFYIVSKCGENIFFFYVVGGVFLSFMYFGFVFGFECLRYGEVLIVCYGFLRWVFVMGVMVEGVKFCFFFKICVNCSFVENVFCGLCFLGLWWVMNVLVDFSWCWFDCLLLWIFIVWIMWFGFGWELVECIWYFVCVCCFWVLKFLFVFFVCLEMFVMWWICVVFRRFVWFVFMF